MNPTTVGNPAPKIKPLSDGWTQLTISSGSLTFPAICAVCMGPKPTEGRAVLDQSKHWDPFYSKYEDLTLQAFCPACARAAYRCSWIGRALIWAGIIAGLVLSIAWGLPRIAGLAVASLMCIPGFVLSGYTSRTIQVTGSRNGMTGIRLKHPQYVIAFENANRSTIAAVSP